MLVTTTTVVSFEVPKDSDELTKFVEHENMSEWYEHFVGPYITYTRKVKTYEIPQITYFEEKDNGEH